MKKFFEIIVVSIILGLLVSVVAAYPHGYEFRTSGTGTAALSMEQSLSSPYSAKLTVATTSDKADILFKGGPTLNSLTALSYWTYTPTGKAGTFDQLTAWIGIFLHTQPGKTYDDWFTDYLAGPPASDNCFYIQAEPYYPYSNYYGVPDISGTFDTWHKWDVFDPTIPLTWVGLESPDLPHEAPTLTDYSTGAAVSFTTPYHGVQSFASREYGTLFISAIRIREGYGGPWVDCVAYVDNVQINDAFFYLETFEYVGGLWVPMNKIALFAPLITIASFITLATVSIVYVRRKKK